MLTVEPWSRLKSNKELRSIRVWSRISHREEVWSCVLQPEVFISEVLTFVDRFTSCAIMFCEISTLCHKIFYNTVKFRVFVWEGVASELTYTILSWTKLYEIPHRYRDCISKKCYCYPSWEFVVYRYIKIGFFRHCINRIKLKTIWVIIYGTLLFLLQTK